jgi:hypothetical protein
LTFFHRRQSSSPRRSSLTAIDLCGIAVTLRQYRSQSD